MQNDRRAPADVRTAMRPWGLCKDEFTDNGNWPHEMYIREGRRMISDFVMTERHLRGQLASPHSIGLGSYSMDSHNVRRYVDAQGHARNEGDVQVSPERDYQISYGAVTPHKAEADNLLVPVALSASHIAYGSIRMEPVYMILGQSTATAAGIAIDRGSAVQDVPYAMLRPMLLKQGQILDAPVESFAARVRRLFRRYFAFAIMMAGGLILAYILLSRMRSRSGPSSGTDVPIGPNATAALPTATLDRT
jgi:hypothetical protein